VLDRLRWLGLAGLALALVLAGLGGAFLARRALAPIDRVTRAAELIGAEDLARRLDLDLPNDEIGRLARAFDGMIGRLDAAFERQRRFTADASHEIRTPLGIIRSQLDVALAHPRTPEQYARVLGDVRDATDRLARLAERLLTLARADAGEALTLIPVDVQDVVAEAAASVAAQARELGVRLDVRLGEAPGVQGDPVWLMQLLLNLLDNALRHTPPGGQVTLTLEASADGSGGDRSSDGGVRVSVADTGEGIAPEHLPRLFERFYRVDAARARSSGGAGLGLAICSWVARAHGGRLDASSAAGVGTTMTLWLPAAPVPPHAEPDCVPALTS
jgi:signal transduction histidine kinase